MSTDTADVIVVGAGLAGLVATAELADAGKRVLLVDAEPEQNLGGQAHWSFGGLFLVDTPEQRRLRVHDSLELARQDWLGTAGFDRDEDHWPRQWAEAYLQFAAGRSAPGCTRWACGSSRSSAGPSAAGTPPPATATRCPGSTSPGAPAPVSSRPSSAGSATPRPAGWWSSASGTGSPAWWSRTAWSPASAATCWSPATHPAGWPPAAPRRGVRARRAGRRRHLRRHRGQPRPGAQELAGPAGPVPERLLSGVPAHVDGSMLLTTEAAGASVVNPDRMWHYTEGIENWDPIWARHGIRILPGPSSLWLDATGKRLPVPLYPGFDTLGTLAHIGTTGHEHTWFVLDQKIVEKEFTLSGSEQNPDLTGKDLKLLLSRVRPGAAAPVQAFLDKGADFVTATSVAELVEGMNRITGGTPRLDAAAVEAEIVARDREMANGFSKDGQVTAIRAARKFLGDKLIRVVPPHRMLDPANGPLIAVRLNLLTRKTLGGLETDLSGRVLQPGGAVFPGLYAAGEVSGFGGGGMHGYRSLEGTFLGGCLFSGRTAGRAVAAAL
ncbi:FAD-binding dehydrogenase [Klenkia terrae]|uniref:FAD-binding dehydrogenase n=1 Tax=Klenkia terrae TaxID=1052259 RepID=UPI003614242F